MTYDSVKAELLENDSEFQRLHREHQDCEGRLETLSAEEQTEAKAIKLHKLALKDRMESMIRAHATP